MNENRFSKMIDELPPLPETILELEKFRQQQDQEPMDLLHILEKDPLIISIILKLSNSAMFGFRNSVETPSKALSLLGINYTLSIAFGYTIKNTLDTDIKPYGLSSDKFMQIASISSNLLSMWLSKVDYQLKEKLLLPVFLQNIGIFILSNLASNEQKVEKFYNELQSDKIVSEVEMEFFNTTTSLVSAHIFKHWKLDSYLANIVEFVDNLDNCPEEFKYESQILHIVKTACDTRDPLSDKNCSLAIQKAKNFGFEIKPLEKAITEMQDRMLDS